MPECVGERQSGGVVAGDEEDEGVPQEDDLVDLLLVVLHRVEHEVDQVVPPYLVALSVWRLPWVMMMQFEPYT